MNYYIISSLINVFASIFLAVLVIVKNPQHKVNRSLAVLCSAVVVWSLPYFFWQISRTTQSAIFWSKALMIGAILIPIFYYRFVLVFLNKSTKNILLYICSLYGFALIVSNFFDLIVDGVEPKLSFAFWPNAGLLYGHFLLIFFSLAAYSTYLLIQEYRHAAGIRKQQIKYIFLGMIVGFTGGSTNYFLWYNIPIPPIGNLFSIFYAVAIVYAIVAHRLMDIKLALRRSSVYLSSLITVIALGYLLEFLFSRLFPSVANWLSYLIIVLVVTIFPSIKEYYFYLSNKYFFTSLYDSSQLIADVSTKLKSTLEINQSCQAIADSLMGAFHLAKLGVLLYDKTSREYKIVYNHGFNVDSARKFKQDATLHKFFITQRLPIIVEEVQKSDIYKKSKRTIDLLTSMNVEILTPINIKNENIALIALGPKESKDIYTKDDLEVLQIIGAQSAIAFKNALLYEESLAFGAKLKTEVRNATKELRAANERLKKLDRAKTEFISITSHELRTPLTGLSGYLSMFLEGDFGKLKPDQREVIQNLFRHTGRLIRLVNMFLNVSRIELGQLFINRFAVDIIELTQSCISELRPEAEKKGLQLEFAPPTEKFPLISLDRDKVQDVILNLMSNAIKYTHRGSIAIKLAQDKKNLVFSVTDTGIGLGQAEITKLFTKFGRGRSAKLGIEGSGLGLYISKNIIEAHGGTIWCESPGKDKGSTFSFKLPLKVEK